MTVERCICLVCSRAARAGVWVRRAANTRSTRPPRPGGVQAQMAALGWAGSHASLHPRAAHPPVPTTTMRSPGADITPPCPRSTVQHDRTVSCETKHTQSREMCLLCAATPSHTVPGQTAPIRPGRNDACEKWCDLSSRCQRGERIPPAALGLRRCGRVCIRWRALGVGPGDTPGDPSEIADRLHAQAPHSMSKTRCGRTHHTRVW